MTTASVSPLQAARYDRGWTQGEACVRIRIACDGHHGQPCQIATTRLSDYERGRKPLTLAHVQALCIVYQRSAEDLGLIAWRTPERRRQAEREARERIREEVLAELAQPGAGQAEATAEH